MSLDGEGHVSLRCSKLCQTEAQRLGSCSRIVILGRRCQPAQHGRGACFGAGVHARRTWSLAFVAARRWRYRFRTASQRRDASAFSSQGHPPSRGHDHEPGGQGAQPVPRVHRMAARAPYQIATFGMATWAPLVPFARDRAHLDHAFRGLLPFYLGVGSVLVMPASGFSAIRDGCWVIIVTASVLICGVPPSWCPSVSRFRSRPTSSYSEAPWAP